MCLVVNTVVRDNDKQLVDRCSMHVGDVDTYVQSTPATPFSLTCPSFPTASTNRYLP